MNSYNENLRSVTITSLDVQQKEIMAAGSQQKAAMMTLFYASGAASQAAHDLEAGTLTLKRIKGLKLKASETSSISQNVLSAATQANQSVKQSVSNAAVSASNVQVASNAITNLASDIGAIFSILQASDSDSVASKLAEEVLSEINETALQAELASQTAMETSMYTSEVSSNAVLGKSNDVDQLAGNIVASLTADETTTKTIVANGNSALTVAVSTVRQAEGAYESAVAAYKSATETYQITNQLLNLGLTVKIDRASSASPALLVSFSLINNPFENSGKPSPTVYQYPKQEQIENYPIERYIIFIVKNRNESIFSLSNAEALVDGGPTLSDKDMRYIPVDNSMDGGGTVVQSAVHQKIDSIAGGDINYLDSDGDIISFGIDYVAFVFGIYSTAYKKSVNDFNNYLSAPSAPFRLTIDVPVATGLEFDGKTFRFNCNPVSKIPGHPTGDAYGVEYRCMLVPAPLPEITLYNSQDQHMLFNRDLASAVAPDNYFSVQASSGIAAEGTPLLSYAVATGKNATDVYGNPVDFNTNRYLAFVLSICNSSSPGINSSFSSMLAGEVRTNGNTEIN